jgi:hypothetical protein
MSMSDARMEAVARILSDWNPLGGEAARIADLNGYRAEAVDIIFEARMTSMAKGSIEAVVRNVLNQAFNLDLTREECREAASRIRAVLLSGDT